MGPGLHNVLYIAMDASKNEATCNFTIEVKGISANTHKYICLVYSKKKKYIIN